MILRISAVALAGVLSLSLAGCVGNRVDLVDAGKLQIEPAPSTEIAVPEPVVWDDEGKLVIWGWMQHKGPSHHFDPGHVHVVLRSANGEELARQAVRLREQATGARAWSRHRSTYSAEFAQVPPAGSKVQVWHCHDKHGNNG